MSLCERQPLRRHGASDRRILNLFDLDWFTDWLLQHGIDDDFVKALNVFQYITFRSIGAAVTAFLLCLMFGNRMIRKLISLKVGQPIRTKEEVNKLFELHGKKAGTPTMGGVLMLGSVVISSLLWARPTTASSGSSCARRSSSAARLLG